MHRHLTITDQPLDEPALFSQRKVSAGIGACLCFSGIVRETEGDQTIKGIDYEAFDRMARHQFELIFGEIEGRWPIESIKVVHRTGFVPVNEASLWVEVAAPHRGEAFAACQYLIDEMKKRVPIWKRATR